MVSPSLSSFRVRGGDRAGSGGARSDTAGSGCGAHLLVAHDKDFFSELHVLLDLERNRRSSGQGCVIKTRGGDLFHGSSAWSGSPSSLVGSEVGGPASEACEGFVHDHDCRVILSCGVWVEARFASVLSGLPLLAELASSRARFLCGSRRTDRFSSFPFLNAVLS